MAKLSAPSGFRDFLPDECRKRAELMRRIRTVYESFGFEPIETPIMENLSVFLGKGGGENEKLMFRVLKRGADLGRALEKKDELADMGMRFDLTVPLARYFATHRAELPNVFKRYHIGPVYRAERAQHGRFREFIQCDVDVLGSESMMVEAEVLHATATALSKLGFTGLKVRLNSRPLLSHLVKTAGVSDELSGAAVTCIDKLDKETREKVQAEMQEKGIPADAATALLDLHASLLSLDSAGRVAEIEKRLGADISLLKPVQEVLALTPKLPSGELLFDPFLARGMDYYTGPVFEIAAEGVPFSLAGGGRYDELIGKLSGAKVPACGFSIGFERVYTLMCERNMFEASSRAADVLLVCRGIENEGKTLLELAETLRVGGVSADVFPGAKKLPQQFEYATKKKITYAILSVDGEGADGQWEIRNIVSREQAKMPRAELAGWLKSKL